MDHVAIMKKSWGLIPKVLNGEKTIESRWYQTKRAPWNKIKKGEMIYFKNSGEAITAKAEVSEVMEFEITEAQQVAELLNKYAKVIGISDDPNQWEVRPRYCVLMRLVSPQAIEPFQIDKTGYGNAAAWLCVEDINKISLK